MQKKKTKYPMLMRIYIRHNWINNPFSQLQKSCCNAIWSPLAGAHSPWLVQWCMRSQFIFSVFHQYNGGHERNITNWNDSIVITATHSSKGKWRKNQEKNIERITCFYQAFDIYCFINKMYFILFHFDSTKRICAHICTKSFRRLLDGCNFSSENRFNDYRILTHTHERTDKHLHVQACGRLSAILLIN